MPSKISIVIPAAGQGRRTGNNNGKLLVPVKGLALAGWTLRALSRWSALSEVVIAVRREEQAEFEKLCARELGALSWQLIEGGATRTESVGKAVAACAASTELIVIHDAARPLVSVATLELAAELALTYGGAVACHRPADALRTVDAEGFMKGTLDRESVRAVQTPQAFRAAALREAYAEALATGQEAHDDAELLFSRGCKVKLFDCDEPNPKVTYPEDFELLERLLEVNV
jgi:2-C-methyl-D-erythritol 4-phosphate cytidylyltransferase